MLNLSISLMENCIIFVVENINELTIEETKPDIRARNIRRNEENTFLEIRVTSANTSFHNRLSPVKFF